MISDGYKFTGDKKAFIASYQQSNVAGQYSYVQLWNPAASGVIGVVEYISYASIDAVSTLVLGIYTSALTTSGALKGNKYLGSAAPALEIRKETNANALGTSIGYLFLDSVANYSKNRPIKQNIIIPNECGLFVRSAAVNHTITVGFEWIEIP